MKILLLVDCDLIEEKSASQMMYDLALELSSCRNQVILLMVSTDLQYKMKVNTVNSFLTILQVKCESDKNGSRWKRALNEIRLSRRIWRNAKSFFRKNRCDFIIYYSPTIFLGDVVLRLKKLWKAKTYLVLRDIFPRWIVDLGLLSSKSIIYKYFQYKEKINYRAADIIGVQSKANKIYFENKCWSRNYKIKTLYNWMALRSIENKPPEIFEKGYRKRLKLDNKIVFVYGGNIGVAQDIDNILRLVKRCRSLQDVYFLIVGSGSEKKRIFTKISKQQLHNISMLPPLKQNEYFSLLSEFDVGLISLSKKLTTHNFPGKMLGYMHASMPIIASINPGNDLYDVISKAQAGFVCENGHDDKFYGLVKQLIDNKKLIKQMGDNARKLLIEKFSIKRATQTILSSLTDIA